MIFMNEKIFAINPGSTSTKIGLFEGEKLIFKQTVSHDATILEQFSKSYDQLDYRKETIMNVLKDQEVDISDCAAFVGRGGGQASCVGGVYEVNDLVLSDARSGKYADHPACLGCAIAHEFAELYNVRAYIANLPSTDEFQDVARLTGVRGVYRKSNTHALNQKEVAMRVASDMGMNYHDSNFIVAHIGGGVSVTAHRQGRMVDSNDIINGDGPMAPTRTGFIPLKDVIDMCFSGDWSAKEMYQLISKTGGFVNHLGTSDTLEIVQRIEAGDAYAKLVYDAFQYQIAKEIGAMAATLKGKVDAIILTGGIANDKSLVANLKDYVGFIAPVIVQAGEFELEALAAGVLRVLRKEETALIYTGKPVFSGFNIPDRKET